MTQEELKKILSKIRNYEINIRKAVNSQLQGSFASVFKGSGLEFDDVRAYQYGDDVRRIDWHVSAKGEATYVKVFREEKEQTVFFLTDVSESQQVGSFKSKKIDMAREVTSVLALSAVKEASEVGLICFSDQKEKYIKPDKGLAKAYEIMINLYRLQPQSSGTDLNAFIHFALNLIKRRSIVILVSDFIDRGYEDAIQALAKKHDLILIHLMDPWELSLPKVGQIPLIDKEKRVIHWANTSSPAFRKRYIRFFEETRDLLESLSHQFQANYLPMSTQDAIVPKMVKLFKVRNRNSRSR